ncbi:MAG: CbtA family protein [Solirubrobacterales bacterium]
MIRKLLICGLLAGVIGGAFATGFAWIAGEPAVDQAIAFEAAQEEATGETPAPDLVARDIQSTFGLLTAMTVFGLSIGGLFALVFTLVYGRVGNASPEKTALLLAFAAFFVVFLVPFLKYPSNPPATGNPDTIGDRTFVYVTMIVFSIGVAASAVWLGRSLRERMSTGTATVVAGAFYVVAMLAIGLIMPGLHEVPSTFPATTLSRFRESTVGIQAVLWTTIGLVFAATAGRVTRGESMLGRPYRNRRLDPATALE